MFTARPENPIPEGSNETDPAYGGPDRRRRVAAAFDPVYVSRFVWRWRWLVAGTSVAGLALGVAIASATPKTYLAWSSILLDPRDLKVVQNEVAPNSLPSDATLALIESQTAVATSDRVLSEVIRKGGLADDPEFNGKERTGLAALVPADLFGAKKPMTEAERMAHINEALRRAMTVAREPKSFIINLSVLTENAEKSARLSNLIAETFIAEIGRIQSDTARRATVALSSRLSELRRTVSEAEGRVEDYKTKNSLIGVDGKLVDDAYITRINDQLARTRADITALRVKAESLRSASVDDVVTGSVPEELSSESLVRLRQNYADLSQQQAALAAKLGPRHPQLIAIQDALKASRQSIQRELARIVAAGQTELDRAEATERDLSAQIDELKSKQAQTSESFVKLRELEREVDASRAVYEAFLLRARETSEQESLNTANVRVISEAVPPIRSAGPSRKLIAAAGGIGGFALGTGLLAALAMLRLLTGFLRVDRRAGGRPRIVWTEAERAAKADSAVEEATATAIRHVAAPPLAAHEPEEVPAFLTRSDVMEPAFEPVEADVTESDPAPETFETEKESAPAIGPRLEETAPTSRFPARLDTPQRAALRERLRAIGTIGPGQPAAEKRGNETATLERELQSVRDALTAIRQKRRTKA